MQMIDVLKRLAELDAGNPNVIHEGQASPELQQLLAMQQKYRGTPYQQQVDKRVASQQWRDANGKGAPVDSTGRPVPVLSPEEFEKKNPNFLKTSAAPAADGMPTADQTALSESLDLAECGMMPMPGMGGQSHTPASISMTANSGPELSGMLADIMKLAGVHQVEPAHLGIEPAHMEPTHDHSDIEVISAEPAPLDGGDETEIMRSMMDRMNGEMDSEEETDEGMYDNSPNSPEPEQSFDANQYAHQENQPGQGDRMDGNMPRAFATMEEKLMADWKQFMTEDTDQDMAEGDSGAKYHVKSVGTKINPATGERCDFYVNPITNKEVFCKPGQKVSKGDHVTPSGTVKPKV